VGVPSSQTLALFFLLSKVPTKTIWLGYYVLGNYQKGGYSREFGPMLHSGLELPSIAPLRSLYNVKKWEEIFFYKEMVIIHLKGKDFHLK